jgi:hypothetical protein
MLLLGNEASDAFRAALTALREEVDAWEGISRSTDLARDLCARRCRDCAEGGGAR